MIRVTFPTKATMFVITKIRLEFGYPARFKREVKWYDSISSFPKCFTFENKFWEWISYDSDKSGYVDYVFYLGETSDPGLPVTNLYDMFRGQFENNTLCECGAVHERGFEHAHMQFCPLYVKL